MAELRGPFFAPGANAVTAVFIHKAQADVAFETERRIHMLHRVFFKKPTGYYDRHIANLDQGYQHLIHDSDVIYGHWLQGTGSRNYPVTRFKGYNVFRKVTRSMQDRAVVIAQPAIRHLVRVLN